MIQIRSFAVALAALATVGLVAAPAPAAAQTQEQLRELVAWVAPLTDIKTRGRQTVASVTAIARSARTAPTRGEAIALLRAAQPDLAAARTHLQVLHREAEALPPFASPGIDASIINLANVALADTKSSILLFDDAVGDLQQMLPALERNDQVQLARLAGRALTFTANVIRGETITLRLVQIQLPADDPMHHAAAARAELSEGLFALLSLPSASDASGLSAAAGRARGWIASGRAVLEAERADFASLEHPTLTALHAINEEQFAAIEAFAADLDRESQRLTPRSPMLQLFEALRRLGEHDRRIQAHNRLAAELALQFADR